MLCTRAGLRVGALVTIFMRNKKKDTNGCALGETSRTIQIYTMEPWIRVKSRTANVPFFLPRMFPMSCDKLVYEL